MTGLPAKIDKEEATVPTPASATDPPVGPPHRPPPTQPPDPAQPPTSATPSVRWRRTSAVAPCGCDCCTPGGFCGGCGHRGCSGRSAPTDPAAPAIRVIEATELQPGDVLRLDDDYAVTVREVKVRGEHVDFVSDKKGVGRLDRTALVAVERPLTALTDPTNVDMRVVEGDQ